jgi:hypothetical protein
MFSLQGMRGTQHEDRRRRKKSHRKPHRRWLHPEHAAYPTKEGKEAEGTVHSWELVCMSPTLG